MWENFLPMAQFAAILVFGWMLLVFVLALWKEDNSIVDSAYGLAFIIVTWTLFFSWQEHTLNQILLVALVTLWGCRLSLRIFWKNWKKPEDFRYHAWRLEWQKRSMLYFAARSLLQIYLLQGAVILVVLTPVILIFSQAHTDTLGWVNWAGLALWCVGFFFEAVGDWQLDRFIKNPANEGKILTTGLWSLTRHPNYFGEASMWWGIWFFLFGLPLWGHVIISPLLITILLLKVSGIPMLEARFAGRTDWEEYKQKTNAFFPRWPRKGVY